MSLVLWRAYWEGPSAAPWRRFLSCDWHSSAQFCVSSENDSSRHLFACASRIYKLSRNYTFFYFFETLREKLLVKQRLVERLCWLWLSLSSRSISVAQVGPGFTTVYLNACYPVIKHSTIQQGWLEKPSPSLKVKVDCLVQLKFEHRVVRERALG